MSALDLSLLVATIDHINNYLPDHMDEADASTDPLLAKLETLAMLHEQRERLQQLEASVEAKCALAMGATDQVEYPDMYAVRRGGRYTRKSWDHATMQSRIAANAAVTPETGEFNGDTYEEVLNLLSVVYALVSVSGYKVRGLLEAGIEFDDACVREPGRRTVTVRRGSPSDEAVA
jgi:hypothetical protein